MLTVNVSKIYSLFVSSMATLYRFFLKGVIPQLQGSAEDVIFSNTLIHAIIFFKEIIRKSREISFSNEASAITKALVEVVDKIDKGDLSTSTKKPEYFEFVFIFYCSA